MESRLFLYYKKILFWKLNAWLSHFCNRWSLYLNKIQIIFNIHNRENWVHIRFVRFLFFLELLVAQRSFLQYLREPKAYTKNRAFSITVALTLRGDCLFSFFEYFHFYTEPFFKRNQLKSWYYVSPFFLLGKINNFNFFPGVSDDVFLRWSYPIFFFYKFKFESFLLQTHQVKNGELQSQSSNILIFKLCRLLLRELGATAAAIANV